MKHIITQKIKCPSCSSTFEMKVTSGISITGSISKAKPKPRPFTCLMCSAVNTVPITITTESLENPSWVWNDIYGCFDKDKEI
jgi:transcription elongation factor Elf1